MAGATQASKQDVQPAEVAADRLEQLAGIIQAQQQQISALATSVKGSKTSTKSPAAESASRELAYRFDAGPKWMEASGWKDQSAKHRKAWPLLRRLLELERWTGARVRATVPQLADYLSVSEDTAKRRLKDLEELEVIERKPGSGRRPTTIEVQHPISAPVGYSEVPWEAGGMDGAPPGHLESLTGARRAYAVLYGVEIPAAGEAPTIPDQDAAPPIEETEEPPTVEEPDELPGPENPQPKVQRVHNTGDGDAEYPPLETNDTLVLRESVMSDAPTRARDQESEEGQDRKQSKQLGEIDSEVEGVAPEEISEDAVSQAQVLVEAVGRYDSRTRADLARIAEYLHRRDERELLVPMAARIKRSRQRTGFAIARPRQYVLAAILDARTENLTPEERALADRVAAAPGPEEGRSDSHSNRPQKNYKRGYEWLFDSEASRDQNAINGLADRGPYEEIRSNNSAEDLATVRELLVRDDEEGDRIRRLLQRAREGRTFAGGRTGEEILSEAAAEILSGDHLDAAHWRPAVELVIHEDDQSNLEGKERYRSQTQETPQSSIGGKDD